MRLTIAAVALFITIQGGITAQPVDTAEWYPGGTYNSSIPTPESILGYEIGSEYTYHYMLKTYMEAVARSSDRVELSSYGMTNEGRELLLLIITSPGNHARLDEIKQNMAMLADPRQVSQERLDNIVEGTPAVAWLSYNVHGNESAGTEAAILTVYQLAAGTDPVTSRILDELVVVIDPLSNPDGRDRYVHDFKKRKGMVFDDDPGAWEHGSDWPGGRTNHYLFDLNRDWAWLTQVETQQRVAEYLKWNPVVHVDFHEMGGESYFFFPAAKPVHDAFPEQIMKWQKYYGEGNAAAFDQFGWPYYTRRGFDMYYPSYGDSWPSMMGATGMTYEQGGGGGVGLAVRRSDGTVHTLRQRVHGHFTTSMATLQTTADRRQERLEDFLGFFRHAVNLGRGNVKAYALVPAVDPYNADQLVGLLTKQGIEVSSAQESFRGRIEGAYWTGGATGSKEFPAGTYLVETGQPKGVAVQMLLERSPTLEDTSFYDLSGWSLPYVYNVEAYTLSELPRVAKVPVVTTPERAGGVVGERARNSYAIPYNGTSALFAAVDLLNRGLRVHTAADVFTIHGRTYPRGTFVIPLRRNPENTHQIVEEVAASHGVMAYPINTGLVEEGTDLGGGDYRPMKKPRIAVAAGSEVGGSFGEAWHFFDQKYPFFDYTNIDASRLGRMDLSDYDVLLLPSARSGRSYQSIFGEEGLVRLRSWLGGGGVLIGLEGGALFATQEVSQLTSVTTSSGGGEAGSRESTDTDEDAPAVEARRTMAEREAESKVNRTPGGVYGGVLDLDHWLAFGMPEQVGVVRRGTRAFNITEKGINVGVFSRQPLLSGYAPPDVPEELSRKAWLIVENVSGGNVVLFADNPLFRMFIEGQHQLVLNAIVLGPAFGGRGRRGR